MSEMIGGGGGSSMPAAAGRAEASAAIAMASAAREIANDGRLNAERWQVGMNDSVAMREVWDGCPIRQQWYWPAAWLNVRVGQGLGRAGGRRRRGDRRPEHGLPPRPDPRAARANSGRARARARRYAPPPPHAQTPPTTSPPPPSPTP